MIAPWWAAVAAATSLAIGELVNRYAFGWLPDDPPRPGRKAHRRPVPLAGVLLLPTILAWCIPTSAWLLGAGLAVAAAIGLEDDRRKEHVDPLGDGGLDWRVKAAGLLVAAGLVASATLDFGAQPWGWGAVFSLAFVLTNAVNFLDNTDGVAASLAAAILLLLAYVALPASPAQAVTAAAGFAAIGFLPFNWPWPRLFLGDSGAYCLGLCCSYAVCEAAIADPKWLLATAVPLADFLQVVAMRLWIGVPPWVGDRRHLTHIARNLGVPSAWIAPMFAALAAATALSALAI